MSIDTGGENPLEDMERITKAANDRDQAVLNNYAKNALPFSFVAKALGKDPIDGWAGLPSVGIQPRVCIESLEERNAAITSIQAREVNGCVLDPITAALASDFHLWKTISEVCRQIHVTQSTLEVFAKREIEAKTILTVKLELPRGKTAIWLSSKLLQSETGHFAKRKVVREKTYWHIAGSLRQFQRPTLQDRT
ncbi:hypothetical protein GGR95_000368 [Sulfitobacter undariae]|uniref:Uncharacterized protein n=1 Tax=Sulfitobacter undariae TaxID=1563671 RepID=A0A7W6H0I9_9RHOB|nr:hypothetical protein [Sulfitobacter undariae]MBB3992749.1 hypothetical protein [Sulfitobacter undariae]